MADNQEKHLERARHIVLKILDCVGAAGMGTTKVAKAFYFAHLYHMRETGRLLSGWPSSHLPFGPAMHGYSRVLAGLVRDGLVETEKVERGPLVETVYTLSRRRVEIAPFSDEETRSIREACRFVSGRTTEELTELTHELSRAWNETRNGETLNVALDILDDEEFDRLQEDYAQAAQTVGAIFEE